MEGDQEPPKRRTIRYPDYNYAMAGCYFITICSYDKRPLFGRIENDGVILSKCGQVVLEEWLKTAEVRPLVDLDEFVIMPDHMHGILLLRESNSIRELRATHRLAPTFASDSTQIARPTLVSGSIGAIIGQFKSVVTKRVRFDNPLFDGPIWQRNYYEHVIRSEPALAKAREYIANNPARWEIERAGNSEEPSW